MIASAGTRGIAATIEGVFASMWFSWGQARAPSWLRTLAGVGGVIGLIVALAGIALALRSRGQPTALRDSDVRRRYNIVVGAEFGVLGVGVLGVGALILGAAGQAEWIAALVCAVVGLHFLALSRVFADLHLVPLGVLITAVAAATLVVGLATSAAPGTVAGPATGTCLLAAAIVTLAGQFRPSMPRPAGAEVHRPFFGGCDEAASRVIDMYGGRAPAARLELVNQTPRNSGSVAVYPKRGVDPGEGIHRRGSLMQQRSGTAVNCTIGVPKCVVR